MARDSSTFHQSATLSSIFLRHDLSVLRWRKGTSARKVAAASPTRFTSIGKRRLVRRAARSIWTPRALSSSGRNSEYGKLDPIMNSVSHSAINSQLGFVPSRPIDPVTQGRSSGSTALPSSAFATPAPSRSATCATSSDAPSAPWPTSIATFAPAFSTSAARRSPSSNGVTRGAWKPMPV
jgi:hypothetical protein